MRTSEFMDWTETLLCNSLPMPHCSQKEWDELITKWRQEKHNRRWRWLLLLPLPLLLLASCNNRQPTRLVGKNGTEMNIGAIQNFAAQGYMSAGFDKNGNPRMTVRDNSEAVPTRVADAAVTLGGGVIFANVQKAKDAGDVALGLGAQKENIAGQAINAGVTKAGLDAGVKTTEILHSIPK